MERISQFISDMINMTEGQKFIEYWWLWLIILSLLVGLSYWSEKDKWQK